MYIHTIWDEPQTTVFSQKIRHSKYPSPARNLSKCILIAGEFPTQETATCCAVVFVPCQSSFYELYIKDN